MGAQARIAVRDVPRSPVLESRIRGMLGRLTKVHPRIIAFHVTLGSSPLCRGGAGRFHVKLDVSVPHTDIVISRDHDRDIYVALREACQGARRQLIAHIARWRGTDGARGRRGRGTATAEIPGNE